MSENRARGVALLGLFLLAAIRASAQDAYPSDITPPAGTQYPCALTALPRGLPGIPQADREYINRTYARVLRATQAKLVLLKALEERQDLDARLGRYLSELEPLVQRQRDDRVPDGLEPFQQDVLCGARPAAGLLLEGRADARCGPRDGRGLPDRRRPAGLGTADRRMVTHAGSLSRMARRDS